jgi:hypothetical protein
MDKLDCQASQLPAQADCIEQDLNHPKGYDSQDGSRRGLTKDCQHPTKEKAED